MTKLADSKYTWWFFAVAIAFVYFYGLGIPLVGPDEPRYSQVAREMFERGDWITPTLGGSDWFEKPALLYWLQIFGYTLFGSNEFAARFGSALFGLGTIASLWMLGRFSRVKETAEESVEFANLLALVSATSLAILVFSRGASFDIIVTFPLTSSLVGFFISDRAENDEGRMRALGLGAFYLFAGVAMLAKGLIGIVFPFGIVAVYFLLSRRFPSKKFLLSLLWGVPLFLLVAATWNVPMYLTHGWKFIDEFYIQHHFQRYTSNKYQHPQPFYFYFWVLPLMTLPWIVWFFGEVYRSVRNLVSDKNIADDNANGSMLAKFAIAWIAVPLLFFSASGSKLPGYILPVVPATAILTGSYLFASIRKQRAIRTRVMLIGAGMLFLIPVLLVFVVPKYADRDSVKRLIETANERGFGTSKVAGFHTISHNAEFYAAGRLIREINGKQKRFDDIAELAGLASASEHPLLVLVPLEHANELSSSDCLSTEPLADNGDLQISVVRTTSLPCN